MDETRKADQRNDLCPKQRSFKPSKWIQTILLKSHKEQYNIPIDPAAILHVDVCSCYFQGTEETKSLFSQVLASKKIERITFRCCKDYLPSLQQDQNRTKNHRIMTQSLQKWICSQFYDIEMDYGHGIVDLSTLESTDRKSIYDANNKYPSAREKTSVLPLQEISIVDINSFGLSVHELIRMFMDSAVPESNNTILSYIHYLSNAFKDFVQAVTSTEGLGHEISDEETTVTFSNLAKFASSIRKKMPLIIQKKENANADVILSDGKEEICFIPTKHKTNNMNRIRILIFSMMRISTEIDSPSYLTPFQMLTEYTKCKVGDENEYRISVGLWFSFIQWSLRGHISNMRLSNYIEYHKDLFEGESYRISSMYMTSFLDRFDSICIIADAPKYLNYIWLTKRKKLRELELLCACKGNEYIYSSFDGPCNKKFKSSIPKRNISFNIDYILDKVSVNRLSLLLCNNCKMQVNRFVRNHEWASFYPNKEKVTKIMFLNSIESILIAHSRKIKMQTQTRTSNFSMVDGTLLSSVPLIWSFLSKYQLDDIDIIQLWRVYQLL